MSRSPDFLSRHDPAVNPTVGALRRTRGFSLVELLVVIAILGVLLALVASAIAPVR